MIYFLEPYKTREYSLITSDWSTAKFEAAFEDGEIVHIESEKALYFYLEFTSFEPKPTTKWKPEEFNWSPPIRAALIFHYGEYQINTKVDGQWKVVKNQPGVVETEICKYLLSSEYLNKPIAGAIDFANSYISRTALSGSDQAHKNQWLEQICAFYIIPEHKKTFLLPSFDKKKSSFSNNTKTAYKAVSITESLEQKEKYVIDILARMLGVVQVEDKITHQQIINALVSLEAQNPMQHKAMMDFVKLIVN